MKWLYKASGHAWRVLRWCVSDLTQDVRVGHHMATHATHDVVMAPNNWHILTCGSWVSSTKPFLQGLWSSNWSKTSKSHIWFSNLSALASLHSNGDATGDILWILSRHLNITSRGGGEWTAHSSNPNKQTSNNSGKVKGISTIDVIWWFDYWWLVCIECLQRSSISAYCSIRYRPGVFIRFWLHPHVWNCTWHHLDFSRAIMSLLMWILKGK